MVKKSKFLEPLAVAVAGGQSIKSGAETVGCSIQTAYNLSASAEFRQKVASIRTEIASSAVGLLTDGATKAASTLVELLDESKEPNVRLNASKAILGALAGITELGELRARIDALEQSGR